MERFSESSENERVQPQLGSLRATAATSSSNGLPLADCRKKSSLRPGASDLRSPVMQKNR